MSISFQVSKEDLAQSKTIKPGLYTLTCKSVVKAPGKSDPTSDVVTFIFVTKSGPDPASIGVPVKWWLSEKFAAAAVPLIEAINGKKVSEEGVEVDFEALVGRDVKGYIKNGMYNGRPTNKIDGFVV
jgi:hypothetical protein